MPFAQPSDLHPTLWRTCRILANKTRLRILRELCAQPDQRVSEIAHRLGLSLPLASQALRALNARGLLLARRIGPLVFYSPIANRSIQDSVSLLSVIRQTFTTDTHPCENIFQYASAFTQPRRLVIIQILSGQRSMRQREIAHKTKIPRRALRRHLGKLHGRGFLECVDGKYACAIPHHRFARLLIQLARNE